MKQYMYYGRVIHDVYTLNVLKGMTDKQAKIKAVNHGRALYHKHSDVLVSYPTAMTWLREYSRSLRSLRMVS